MHGVTGHVIGYVVGKPKMNKTSSNADVLNFMVEHRGRTIRDGQWRDAAPVRVRCNAFGDIARNAEKGVMPGDRVVVVGAFRERPGAGLEMDVEAMGLDFRETELEEAPQ